MMKDSTTKPTRRRTRARMLLAAGVALVIATQLLPGAPLLAQTTDQTRVPWLAGHTFVPNALTQDPFIKTYVRNSIGLGIVKNLETSLIEIGDEPVVGLQGDLVNALLEFEYQQAVRDWMAFYMNVHVLGRLGTGAQALLAEGITANTGFEFGWLFKITQSKRTMLSGSLALMNNSTTVVNILDWVEGVIEDRPVSLVQTIPSVRGSGGLRFAWAVSDLIGILMLGELGYGESADRTSDDEWFYDIGATIDFDLLAKTSVPLGFAVGYHVDTFLYGGGDISGNYHEFLFRTSFTGSAEFRISLDVTYGQLPTSSSYNETLDVVSAAINLRYYF